MKKKINYFWLGALLLTPIILWILPADFFDEGETICPSKIFFDLECLGCGMTRAVMHLHHLELDEAIYYNYGVVLIFPTLILVWCIWVRAAFKTVKNAQKL